ncbi:hypothetical protein GWK91_11270 [Virgibacillus sp. MSP4-1]|uniref:hypothetical protein n=1 Tax=Virgibacillus sp. MSP4-1 TaxID=2700081 RepID=UPI00039A5E37|nr:hypothetical protein [Virgibacillus sp. MSP4-1]QHS23502.1 hypothetical protein GWK91_11270 [Virgibacillus sp. MSP4-1]
MTQEEREFAAILKKFYWNGKKSTSSMDAIMEDLKQDLKRYINNTQPDVVNKKSLE